MWAEGCAGGVCHSPAEGVCQRGCRCFEPPHALGGLLCGRRGAPEVCAIALPRGRSGGGVPEPCRGGVPEGSVAVGPPHALGGLLCGRRGAPEECAIAMPRG